MSFFFSAAAALFHDNPFIQTYYNRKFLFFSIFPVMCVKKRDSQERIICVCFSKKKKKSLPFLFWLQKTENQTKTDLGSKGWLTIWLDPNWQQAIFKLYTHFIIPWNNYWKARQNFLVRADLIIEHKDISHNTLMVTRLLIRKSCRRYLFKENAQKDYFFFNFFFFSRSRKSVTICKGENKRRSNSCPLLNKWKGEIHYSCAAG